MMNCYDGCVVIVIGGVSGIGCVCFVWFVLEGVCVLVVDFDVDCGVEMVVMLGVEGVEVCFVVMDMLSFDVNEVMV